jgi:hypothetical protein
MNRVDCKAFITFDSEIIDLSVKDGTRYFRTVYSRRGLVNASSAKHSENTALYIKNPIHQNTTLIRHVIFMAFPLKKTL